jgi:hypothetical protein
MALQKALPSPTKVGVDAVVSVGASGSLVVLPPSEQAPSASVSATRTIRRRRRISPAR